MSPEKPPARQRPGYRWEYREGCRCKSCPWKGNCLGETRPHWIEVKEASGMSDHQSAISEPQKAVVQSGLPINKAKADQLARLQRSREWLSKYRTDPEGALRRMGETDWVNPETGQTDLLND